MKLKEEVPLLRSVLIWAVAIVLGLVLFGMIDSALEPSASSWDLRSMWN